MAKSQRLFLIDGMAIAYRAYFAFIQRPLINSRGENTSAVYGFTTFLNKLLSDESPDYIAVISDTPAPTFRHKAYKDYKATRQKMPEDMVAQLAYLRDLVAAFQIPFVEMEGFEADDIMGTYAKRAAKDHVETFLVTGDKDFMQLVSDTVKMYRPGRRGDDVEIVGIEEVKKKFGVTPDKVVDVLGLIGDSSDNVPGVPGIGEKTAIPLIQQFGSIEGVYKNIDKIPQKGVRAKLDANKELALLSKQLVTIHTDVPVRVDFHSLKSENKNVEKLLELYERMEFRTLARNLRSAGTGTPLTAAVSTPPPPGDERPQETIQTGVHAYHLIEEDDDLDRLLEKLSRAKEIVFDTETTSTDPLNAELVGVSFAMNEREAFYVTVQDAADPDHTKGVGEKRLLKSLKPILENSRIQKIGHNLKYDILMFARRGIDVAGDLFDTMVASYILRPDARHNMDDAAAEYLRYTTVTYEELVGTGKDAKHIREVDIHALSDYSCEDADITFRLYRCFKPKLESESQSNLCRDVEFPLVSVLARMERTGVSVDLSVLSGMSKDLDRELGTLTKEIYRLAGTEFNINSTQQLGEILFVKLKLPPVRKTKTGFSTDVAVLETLRHEHEIVEKMLEYRQLSKLKSTYVDAIPRLVSPEDGRVHTSYNQTVAATGRLSSSDPNLQNIPIRTELGRSIRQAFVASTKNSALMSADYSQIELRVMAHISGDEALTEAFRGGEDVHATTAAGVFGVRLEKVTRDMRRKAKEVNFGIMYGIGPFGLANRLDIAQSEAKDIIARYFDRFPKVRQYINDTIAEARNTGYVKTLLGRRRYLPDLRSANQNVRQNAERQAINMPIQGTAADMIKRAMVLIDREIQRRGFASAMLMQVHDELVFEVVKKEEQEMRSLVEEKMQTAMPLSVPIGVEIGSGRNWLEAH